MNHDGQPRQPPRPNPYRYAGCPQELWPEPEEKPEMDPVEFCEMTGAEQVDHVHTLNAPERLLLLYRLSTELSLTRQVIRDQGEARGEACPTCKGEGWIGHYLVTHKCAACGGTGKLPDPTTAALESLPAAELARQNGHELEAFNERVARGFEL